MPIAIVITCPRMLVRTLYTLFFAFDILIVYTSFRSSGIFDSDHEAISDTTRTPTEDAKTASKGWQ